MSTTETSLSRIPFRLEDERMIASMARWMRFIATITIVGGFLMVLLTLVGATVVSHALRTGTIHLGKIEPLIRENPLVFGALGVFSLITAVMTIVAGFTAGDAERLAVGRHGIFVDRQGRDWDAVVIKLV